MKATEPSAPEDRRQRKARRTRDALATAALDLILERGLAGTTVKFAVDTFGGLDLAVNNVGIGGPSAPTGEYDIAACDRVVRTAAEYAAKGIRVNGSYHLVDGACTAASTRLSHTAIQTVDAEVNRERADSERSTHRPRESGR